ncbi:phosphotransferase family protein [Mycobacterium sp. SMC-8]|uniref:phosphotransferase family protein n=1 Tax=Mycobacterium sp. SMC-8 TaxID=2857060 RepID=UPI0021B267FB|nr:phosphotransferase family protein [Mycobacterium sp. SMC-8]UXA11575.1 phosphotransferase family protein [Mycobacterium sp. SMC-8]
MVDAEMQDGSTQELFMRLDRGDPAASGDPFTLDREARFYAALEGTAVPVPRLVASHQTVQAILTERVAGEPWFSRLTDESARLAVAREFMTKLAALHRVDVSRVDLDEPRATVRDGLEADIARWEGMYRFGDAPKDPTIEFGLLWLKANAPDTGAMRPVIVQGDTGPGNFLYDHGRVTAVLDWELAHFGDPMADLGWLALRAVQEPFTNLADRLADYERESGIAVDLRRLRYYRIFAELKVVILSYRRTLDIDVLSEVGNGLGFEGLHGRLFVDALAEQYGLRLQLPDRPAVPPTADDYLFEVMLAQFKEIVVPGSADPFVALRAKGLARIVKYLRQVDQYGDWSSDRELDAAEAILGYRPVTSRDARKLVSDQMDDAALHDSQYVEYLWICAHVRHELLRPAMGVLADRHFDPLPDEIDQDLAPLPKEKQRSNA